MTTLNWMLAAALSLGAGAAFAHGVTLHAASAPVAKEQKDWGIAGDAGPALRTVTLRMTDDMRFAANHFTVKQGETVRLRVENKGRVMHEVVLGTQETLAAHAQMMLKFPGMEHEEPYMAHVPPGQSADLVWNFNRVGNFEFACLIAGHYQAGMTGTFTVTP